MSFSDKDVRNVANLARLKFSDSDMQKLQGDLNSVMDWIDSLKAVDVEGVEPLLNVLTHNLTVRADVVNVQNSREDVLANAPDSDSDDFAKREFFAVPKVIE